MFKYIMKINEKEYNSIFDYINEISTVLDEYHKVYNNYIDMHPVTPENILKYLETNSTSIFKVTDENVNSYINEYKHYVEQSASVEQYNYIKNQWNPEIIKPEAFIWCIAYTSHHRLHACIYDDVLDKWTDNGYFDTSIKSTKLAGPEYEKVLFWTPLCFDKPAGTVIDCISYVDFPEHRFMEGTAGKYVEFMPNDICKFRMKYGKVTTKPYLYRTMTYKQFQDNYTFNDIVEILLETADIEDTINNEILKKNISEKLELLERHIKAANEKIESNIKNMVCTEESEYAYLSKSIPAHFNEVIDTVMKQCKNKNLDESIIYEFQQLIEIIAYKRQTGKSTKLINETVNKFFELPMHTAIPVKDHCEIENIRFFIDCLKSRLDSYKIKYDIKPEQQSDGKIQYFLYRLDKTPYEKACSRFEELCKKYKI